MTGCWTCWRRLSGPAAPSRPEYQRRARRFLTFKDQQNCRRIFDAVLSARPAARGLRDGGVPEIVQTAGHRLRGSRFYFPAMRRFFRAVSRTPAAEDLIVFESGLGTQYADSPRYVYEELVRRGDQRRKVWVYHRKLPGSDPRTKVVRRLSPGYFWYLARAKYWVNNQNFPHYLRRRRNGVFIQTWHGTPLKRMLHDLEQVHGRDEDYMARVNQAVRQWSVLLSPSPYATDVPSAAPSATGGPVLEEGYPRNDVLALGRRSDAGNVIRERLGIPHGRRVVLYAPTFRDDQSTGTGRFGFELPLDLEAFQRRFGADTVLLLRMHVLIANRLAIPESVAGCVRDVSGYPEIQELLLASDVLVTDYSSVLFDYAILRRPIVFYAYDLEHYRDTLRGFYLDYGPNLPGPVAQTEDELFDALAEAAVPDPVRDRRLEEFAARFAPKDDGGAARRVVDQLLPPVPPRQRTVRMMPGRRARTTATAGVVVASLTCRAPSPAGRAPGSEPHGLRAPVPGPAGGSCTILGPPSTRLGAGLGCLTGLAIVRPRPQAYGPRNRCQSPWPSAPRSAPGSECSRSSVPGH